GYQFVDPASASRLFKPRGTAAHKGSAGHSLIIAGSTGKTVAAAMAANSAVRTGAGLVTLAVPAALNPILEQKCTEAMTLPVGRAETTHFQAGALPTLLRAARGKDAVAHGPGLGNHPATVYLV